VFTELLPGKALIKFDYAGEAQQKFTGLDWNELVVGQSSASKNSSTDPEDIARSITRKRLVKAQQTEKTVPAFVNCRV
jgi:hypothetical protein